VGGKTGTAEKPDKGRYARNKLISSFCGVFPIEDPQYLVFIMMDEPHGNRASAGFATGGWTAAPAVGKVIARIAPLLGVRPIEQEEAPVAGITRVNAVRTP